MRIKAGNTQTEDAQTIDFGTGWALVDAGRHVTVSSNSLNSDGTLTTAAVVAALVGSLAKGTVNVLDYGAVAGASVDQKSVIEAALTAAGHSPILIPSDSTANTYKVSGLVVPLVGKIFAEGVSVVPFGNNQTVVSLAGGLALQDGTFQLIRGMRIECTGKTGITGIALATVNAGSAILENDYVVNADTVSVNFEAAQFLRTYNLRATGGTGVGFLIRNAAGTGGANSHDHYGLHAVTKEVGIFCNGNHYLPLHSLNFYNPQCLFNTVCGMAFFAADATVYGGAPEGNGAGAATITVDGQTVKRCSVQVNASVVRLVGFRIPEATVTPCIIVENGSVLTLEDASGYGASGGVVVQCDATSSVHLKGVFNCIGKVQGVASWPDAWILPAGEASIMSGQPVLRKDPQLPVLFAEQATAWVSAASTPPTSNAFAEDALMGYCRSVQFQASLGDQNANHVRIQTPNIVASQDTVISVLVKADRDCTIGLQTACGATFNLILAGTGDINLKAGVVTRIICGRRNLPAGTFTFFFYTRDTTGPTMQISNFQVYQGATGTQTTTQEIAEICKLGAFNDGVTRETATNLALIAQAVNQTAKYPGKQVWDVTNNRVVFAAGQATNAVWKDGVNSTVYTPV